MFEFEWHIHGKEIESKLECLALWRYFLQLQIDDEECVHFTWASLSSSWDFSCDAVADCITTSEAVQDALTDFIQNWDFILQGEWTFENTVTFNDSVLFTAEVTFEWGPVNFSDLTINRDEVVWNVNNSTFNISTTDLNFIESNINLDEDSTFTNEWDTILNGDTTIENLTVTNFVLWPGTDLVWMISADANNCLTTWTDGWLYIACWGGWSFTCSDVADCIGSSTDVQDALEAFIEAWNFETNWDWIFNWSVTFNWAVSWIWWGWSTVEDKFETFIAAESISIWDHVSLSYYIQQQSDDSDLINSINSANVWVWVTVNYGEAFPWEVSSPVNTFVPRIRISTVSESWWSNQGTAYSLTAKIYAISGSLWTTAVNTWPALLTSNVVSWSVSFTTVVLNPTFTFDWITNLPAWNYAIKIEWTITSSVTNNSGVIRFYGDNTGSYVWNAINNSSAVAADDLSFVLKSTVWFVVKSDASNTDRLLYRGKATEAKIVWENIIIQTRWTIAQTWATNAREVRYLSNTLWTLASTPWTNTIIVWKWISTNNVSLRWLADLSDTELLTNAFNTTANGTTVWQRYLAWGWTINISSTINLWWWTNALSLDISRDGTTWYTIWYRSKISGSGNVENQPYWSFTIPKNHFVRLVNTATSWGSTDINYLSVIPF